MGEMMTHPVEGRYVEWPLRAALADIDERLVRIEEAVGIYNGRRKPPEPVSEAAE